MEAYQVNLNQSTDPQSSTQFWLTNQDDIFHCYPKTSTIDQTQKTNQGRVESNGANSLMEVKWLLLLLGFFL